MIIGLRIKCPVLKRIVNIPRADFAIGPLEDVENRMYTIRCKCGRLHTIPTVSVSKPTKTRQAVPK